MSDKELMILRLLIDHPNGLYGSDLVELSCGVLGRGSIYTMLSRMIAKGFVNEATEEPEEPDLTPRTRHTVSASGHRAYREFLAVHGLSMIERKPMGASAKLLLAIMTLLSSLPANASARPPEGWWKELYEFLPEGSGPVILGLGLGLGIAVFLYPLGRGGVGRTSPCGRLRPLCDLIPGPTLRKSVIKLVADQERHIKYLRRHGRVWAGRWILWWTWLLAIYVIAVATALAIIEYIVRRKSE